MIPAPDLSTRPLSVTVEREMATAPELCFWAFTEQLDRWFAAPGTLLATGEANTPFYFEVHQGETRHPHYGRFLELEPGRLVTMTWLTRGTQGHETLLTVELAPAGAGTRLSLTHAGFPDEASRQAHAEAWPQVLANLDEVMS